MADVFISYKREDRRIVEQLSQALSDLGLAVWFDYSIDVGENWSRRIQQELDEAKAILVCWTPEACRSDWVKHEASVGKQRRVLLPVMLRPCKLPDLYASLQSADLTHWDGSPADPRFLALLTPLERLTGRKRLTKEGHQRAGGRREDLVNLLRAVLVERARSGESPFTYAEAEAELRRVARVQGVSMAGFAQPSLWGALDEVADQNRRSREPPLSVLVVDTVSGLPGRGYFQKHVFLEGNHDDLEQRVFRRHLARVRKHVWDRDP